MWEERHFPDKRERDRLLIALMAYGRLRQGELLGLDWDDVDVSRRLVRIRHRRPGHVFSRRGDRRDAAPPWPGQGAVLPRELRPGRNRPDPDHSGARDERRRGDRGGGEGARPDPAADRAGRPRFRPQLADRPARPRPAGASQLAARARLRRRRRGRRRRNRRPAPRRARSRSRSQGATRPFGRGLRDVWLAQGAGRIQGVRDGRAVESWFLPGGGDEPYVYTHVLDTAATAEVRRDLGIRTKGRA